MLEKSKVFLIKKYFLAALSNEKFNRLRKKRQIKEDKRVK